MSSFGSAPHGFRPSAGWPRDALERSGRSGVLPERTRGQPWGQRRAGPVDDGESGGCFDLVDNLSQRAVAAVVEGACCRSDRAVALVLLEAGWAIAGAGGAEPSRL